MIDVLIGERKFSKKEMCHLSWDKLKRKTCHLKWDGESKNCVVLISNWFKFFVEIVTPFDLRFKINETFLLNTRFKDLIFKELKQKEYSMREEKVEK